MTRDCDALRRRRVARIFVVLSTVATFAAGTALAVNKDPPKTKVGPPRETTGAPPCVPQQDYSGNYTCTDPSGTRWNCTIQSNGWHCTEVQDPPPKEPVPPPKKKK